MIEVDRAMIQRLSETMVKRRDGLWNPEAPWLDNAENEHTRIPGLDEGAEGDSDDVQLLDRSQYEERWRQYASEDPAFDRPEALVSILGSA
jgi:hypothetical protein